MDVTTAGIAIAAMIYFGGIAIVAFMVWRTRTPRPAAEPADEFGDAPALMSNPDLPPLQPRTPRAVISPALRGPAGRRRR